MWRATLGASLQELRFIVGTAESSNGLREFIKTTYVPLKAMNPTFPLLVREGSAVHPTIVARYVCSQFGFRTVFTKHF